MPSILGAVGGLRSCDMTLRSRLRAARRSQRPRPPVGESKNSALSISECDPMFCDIRQRVTANAEDLGRRRIGDHWALFLDSRTVMPADEAVRKDRKIQRIRAV